MLRIVQMGPPPDQENLLRMMENPMFLSQMNEAMNNPAVIQMMRDSPMIRDNPMARAMLDNPALRQMMISPETIRAQMQLNRAMGGGAGAGGSFPAPGTTDNTAANSTTGTGENAAQGAGNANNAGANNPLGNNPPFNLFANPNLFAGGDANPLAQMLGMGMPQANTPTTSPPSANAPNQDTTTQTNPSQQQQGNQPTAPNPFAALFGMPANNNNNNNNNTTDTATPNDPTNPNQPPNNNDNPFAQMVQHVMQGLTQNPNAPRELPDPATLMRLGAMPGFNPAQFGAGLGGGAGGAQQPAQPADTRPPEERYADQLRQLNDMGFFEFERNVTALRRSGGSVQGAVEYLLSDI